MAKTKTKEKITIEALGNHVVIVMDKTEEITKGGIILTEGAQERPVVGTVVSVGQECQYVQGGDRVFVPHLAGTKIEVFGQEAMVLMEEEILVRLKNG